MKKKKEAVKITLKDKARNFRNEIRKTTTTAIMAAFGFVIALSWRDVVTEYVESVTAVSPLGGKLIEAIIITIVCVFGIVLLSGSNTQQ